MKIKEIKFSNGSIIQSVYLLENIINLNIKYLFPRGNGKSAMTMIKFLELYYNTILTDDEKLAIWNMFYRGEN